MAGKINITVTRGVTYRAKIYIKNDNDQPVDLTGVVPLMRLLPVASEPVSPVDLDSVNGKLIVSKAAAGELSLNISASDAATYTWGKARHYLTLTFTNGDIHNPYDGEVATRPLGG